MNLLLKNCIKTILSACGIFFYAFGLSAQEIVTDTITIQYRNDVYIPAAFIISSVKDNRKTNPKLVGYSQKKKFLLIPVDQEICTKKKLANYLYSNTKPGLQFDTLLIEIDYFIIEKHSGRLYNPFLLKADLPLKKIQNGIPVAIGTLSYNYEYKPMLRKTPRSEVCENMLEEWDRVLKIDLLSVNSYLKGQESKPENLVYIKPGKSHFFNVAIGTVIGYNFWQLDGELFFTRPEIKPSQWFLGSFIRYQHTPELEMVGFGKKTEHFYKRINKNFAYDISSNLLLGLNKWENTDEIKLQQLVQLSLSSNQSLVYSKINQPGLILKAGLFENMYYIIEKPLKFQIGLCLNVGYKF